MRERILFLLILAIMSSCSTDKKQTDSTKSAPTSTAITYSVVKSYPHDTTSFTEGFVFHEEKLLESTGAPEDLPQTKSAIGITDLSTGKFNQKVQIDKTIYSGEGIALFENKLYQLTYKHRLCFMYDANTFKQIGQFSYGNKEGWGLTTDGTSLIMSDGTSNLTYFDPKKRIPTKSISVTQNGLSTDRLNELEYIKGYIYANIWMKNIIVKIDPATGYIVGELDLSSLAYDAKTKNPRIDVMNGIAYNSITDRIYVTGKLWANVYEISFAH